MFEKVVTVEKTIDTKITSLTEKSTLDIGKVAAVEEKNTETNPVVENRCNKRVVKINTV